MFLLISSLERLWKFTHHNLTFNSCHYTYYLSQRQYLFFLPPKKVTPLTHPLLLPICSICRSKISNFIFCLVPSECVLLV